MATQSPRVVVCGSIITVRSNDGNTFAFDGRKEDITTDIRDSAPNTVRLKSPLKGTLIAPASRDDRFPPKNTTLILWVECDSPEDAIATMSAIDDAVSAVTNADSRLPRPYDDQHYSWEERQAWE